MPKRYLELEEMNAEEKEKLITQFEQVLSSVKVSDFKKIELLIPSIIDDCKMNYYSRYNRLNKKGKLHPISPIRGQIYNASIGENVGAELCDNHLVIIVQNIKGNMFGEKVNILPIEGDGKRVNPNYQVELKNDDLESGRLDKNPSRVILTDVTTIDKARLNRLIAKIKPEKMIEINEKLLHQLALDNNEEKKMIIERDKAKKQLEH